MGHRSKCLQRNDVNNLYIERNLCGAMTHEREREHTIVFAVIAFMGATKIIKWQFISDWMFSYFFIAECEIYQNSSNNVWVFYFGVYFVYFASKVEVLCNIKNIFKTEYWVYKNHIQKLKDACE